MPDDSRLYRRRTHRPARIAGDPPMNRRYSHEISPRDFPKEGPRTVFLGKVAERGQGVHFDIDDLCTHAIIAGSTGGGKTTAGQVIVEGALGHNVAVLVIDPTLQWTGFLKPLD